MNGSDLLLDTNVLLYFVGGKIDAKDLPDGKSAIPFVTELEILSYPGMTSEEEVPIKSLLDEIPIVDINREIKEGTIKLGKLYKLKLPDAIVAASAGH